MSDIKKLTDLVSGEQLKDILSVYATAINGIKSALNTKANAASLGVNTKRIDDLEEHKVSNDSQYKAARQLVIDYMLPSYRTGQTYRKDAIIRLGGRVFKSLVDNNNEIPYSSLNADDGTPIVNASWQVIIAEDVNAENWAQIPDSDIPLYSIPERQDLLEAQWQDKQQDMDASVAAYVAAMQQALKDAEDKMIALEARYNSVLRRQERLINRLTRYQFMVADSELDAEDEPTTTE